MKNKTIYIIIGILVVVVIIFLIWRSNKRQQMQLQAQLQQQQMQNMYGTNPQQQSNLSGTINSVGDVIDSITSLWGTIKNDSSAPGGSIDDATYNQIVNECEMYYNTDQQVQDCINDKLNQLA